MARGDRWTGEEEDKLAEMALEGKTPFEIALALDRSVNAIEIRFADIVHKRTQWKQLVDKLKESQ